MIKFLKNETFLRYLWYVYLVTAIGTLFVVAGSMLSYFVFGIPVTIAFVFPLTIAMWILIFARFVDPNYWSRYRGMDDDRQYD